MNEDLERIKKIIAPLLKKFDITKSAIFGSAVRGELNDESDIRLAPI